MGPHQTKCRNKNLTYYERHFSFVTVLFYRRLSFCHGKWVKYKNRMNFEFWKSDTNRVDTGISVQSYNPPWYSKHRGERGTMNIRAEWKCHIKSTWHVWCEQCTMLKFGKAWDSLIDLGALVDKNRRCTPRAFTLLPTYPIKLKHP